MATTELPTFDFGTRLRRMRKQAHLTQDEAAAECGVTPKTYGEWERNKRYPSRVVIMGLAHLFNVPVQWLTAEEHRDEGQVEDGTRANNSFAA